jgi:molybdopterin adenylyltransferase
MELRVGILTTSDRSAIGERIDETSPALLKEIIAAKWSVIRVAVIPDDLILIRETLKAWVDKKDIDIILTTGGTGFSPRDNTPEATRAIVERLAPGLAEAMRYHSMQKTPHAMLSRGIAGIRQGILIINLPGSPKGAVENFQVIQPVLNHACELLRNDPASEKHH